MRVLTMVMAIFAVIGCIDRITGCRYKLGKEFEKGIMSAGTLALSMVGMITIAPVFSQILMLIIRPIAENTGIDPSVFVSAFFANDMGGAALAKECTYSPQIGNFNALIVSAMMGVTFSFTIPVALQTVEKEYHQDVLLGILCGIITIPIGCFVSGMMLHIPFLMLLKNLIPVILFSVLICIAITVNTKICVKAFSLLGKGITALISIGLGAGILKELTGIKIIKNILPLSEGFDIVFEISIVLAGVFPLVAVISKVFSGVFLRVGQLMKINQNSVQGMITTLANTIPTFETASDMDKKGRIINMAFAVSAGFVFGDHLAFTLAFDDRYVAAMIAGKLIAGISAVLLAIIIVQKFEKEIMR